MRSFEDFEIDQGFLTDYFGDNINVVIPDGMTLAGDETKYSIEYIYD